MKNLLLSLCLFACIGGKAQSLYFPPYGTGTWNTLDPETSMGWCNPSIQELYDYLEQTNTKAFIILKEGKIVLEKYFGTFTKDSLWVWNSAGKTLTSMAVGIAQEKGLLSIEDSTSKYLDTAWTKATPEKEALIKIRHQLTMTSGLGHSGDAYCTDPACLVYVTDPGNRWSYHNGPYTLLDKVIESASGVAFNDFVQTNIRAKIGMQGIFIKSGYNNVHVSNARSMARFGLLLLAKGNWGGVQVLSDQNYFTKMTTPSQTMNPSYGYLTWLNGQSSSMLPSPDVQISIPGPLMPNAPQDIFAALGKNGQFINVSPSQNLVLIRMGDSDGNSLVPTQYNDTIWQKINQLNCLSGLHNLDQSTVVFYPNPAQDLLKVSATGSIDKLRCFDLNGREIVLQEQNKSWIVKDLEAGTYILQYENSGMLQRQYLIKE